MNFSQYFCHEALAELFDVWPWKREVVTGIYFITLYIVNQVDEKTIGLLVPGEGWLNKKLTKTLLLQNIKWICSASLCQSEDPARVKH